MARSLAAWTVVLWMQLAPWAAAARERAPEPTSVRDGAPAEAAARDTASIFEALSGAWRGEGTLMGRPARFTMEWRHEGAFAVLTFSNGFVAAGGEVTPVLRSVALYRTSRSEADGVWLDSRGVRVEIRWEASDSSLVSEWSAPSESGRTTYRLLPSDELEVVDEVLRGETLRVFGTARYRRGG